MGMRACYQMVNANDLNELMKKSFDDLFDAIEDMQEDEDTVLDIDKLWDGMHFLITGTSAAQPLDGNLLSEAVVGTKTFSDDEDADFIAYILPEKVPSILNALAQFDIECAIDRFNPNEFAQQDIYPNIWMRESRESLQDELKECFWEMRKFYEQAATAENAVVISIY